MLVDFITVFFYLSLFLGIWFQNKLWMHKQKKTYFALGLAKHRIIIINTLVGMLKVAYIWSSPRHLVIALIKIILNLYINIYIYKI